MSPTDSPSTRDVRIARICVVAAITWAVVADVAMARTDFWLDEVWSWSQAQKLTSPWQVFTTLHVDNNHYINTLWMWLLGPTPHWSLYRIPSLIGGIGSVILFARIGWRRSPREGVLAALLGGSSYLIAEYASEARGYTLAIFFSLVCLDQWQAEQASPKRWRSVVFSVSAILGMLGHLTFMFPYAGILALDARSWLQRGRDIRGIVSFHAAPFATLAVLWWIDLRFMHIGGGPAFTKSKIFSQLIGLTFGSQRLWPDPISIGIIVLAGVLFATALLTLDKERTNDRIFYVVAILLAPAAVLLLTKPAMVYPRYLLTCMPPFLLLLASLGAGARPMTVRTATTIVIVVVLFANAYLTIRFFPSGRGGYWEAYRDIQTASTKPVIAVGGEHDFRDSKMLEFYGPLLPPTPRLAYSNSSEWMARPPDWLIFETDTEPPPKKRIRLDNGAMYEWTKTYPDVALVSGFTWHVYRRVPAG